MLVPLLASAYVPQASKASLAFAANIRVTDGNSTFPYQVEPYLVVDQRERLAIGWKEASTEISAGQRVGFARSLDGGLTWSPRVLMARIDSTQRQSDPWLALDEGGRLYYARLEYNNDLTRGNLTVSRSDDGGATWGSTVAVDDQPGFADKESMASDGNGSLYVAYDHVSPVNDGSVDVRFTSSQDTGGTWLPTTIVTDRPGQVLGPVIAPQRQGTVSVVWWDSRSGNIMIDTSPDGGRHWSADRRVNAVNGSARWDPKTRWRNSLPSVVVNGTGSLFVAWPDRGNGDLDIVVARSDDGGLTWSTPVRINDDDHQDQWMVALAVDGNQVFHAAWMDNRTGNLNVYYSNSTDGGRNWSSNQRVTTEETPSTFARPGDYLGLAADRYGSVYVAWTDGRNGDLDIYFARKLRHRPPVASFALNPTMGETNTTFTTDASPSAGGDDPTADLQFSWDWGDGTTVPWSAERVQHHRYAKAGVYTILLEVRDPLGDTDSSTRKVEVSWPRLVLSLRAAPVAGVVPLNVAFAVEVDGGAPSYTFAWDFGDGAMGNTPTPRHTYLLAGTYRASVLVGDQEGARSRLGASITTFAPLALRIFSDSYGGPAPLPVFFRSEPTGGLSPYTFHWDFGDGAFNSDPKPQHIYGVSGSYTVVLRVLDGSGQTAEANLPVVVEEPLEHTDLPRASLANPLTPVPLALPASLIALRYWLFRRERRRRPGM